MPAKLDDCPCVPLLAVFPPAQPHPTITVCEVFVIAILLINTPPAHQPHPPDPAPEAAPPPPPPPPTTKYSTFPALFGVNVPLLVNV